MRAEDR